MQFLVKFVMLRMLCSMRLPKCNVVGLIEKPGNYVLPIIKLRENMLFFFKILFFVFQITYDK